MPIPTITNGHPIYRQRDPATTVASALSVLVTHAASATVNTVASETNQTGSTVIKHHLYTVLISDIEISRLAQEGMITPYIGTLIREAEGRKLISYGPSSYGYDLRLSPKAFYVFKHVPGTVMNPKAFNPSNLEQVELHHDQWGSYFILPAHSYGLGVAMERLQLPDDITALFIGKSTYARMGVIANLTPGEAGWRGHLTLEFSNSAGADCRIYANEGIVQALFFRGEPCSTTYRDRNGKYQDQPEDVVTARA